jgi:TonB family protein
MRSPAEIRSKCAIARPTSCSSSCSSLSRGGAVVWGVIIGFRSRTWVRGTLWKDVVRIQSAAHRSRARANAGVASAVATSLGVHGLLVVAVILPLWRAAQGNLSGSVPPQYDVFAVDATLPCWVDLVSPSTLPPESLSVPEVINESSSAVALDSGARARMGTLAGGRAPAPDQGTNVGKMLSPAFRLDRSTLHERLTNAAHVYAPEHEHTAQSASSRQAERREPTVGVGDFARRQRPSTNTRSALSPPGDESDEKAQAFLALDEKPRLAESGTGVFRVVGPLDAEEGERRFDVEREGIARDSRSTPLLSDDAHPSKMDLSAASAPGPKNGSLGHGIGEGPGAVAGFSRGSSPSTKGNRGVAASGGAGDDAAERLRVHHELDIRRRIDQFLRFPQHLALMLEQGETILAFVVAADGRLAGRIEVVKSAGFVEFDEEAVAAVRRAAPFSPPGRTLALSLRVPFQNPVVR